VSVTLIIEYVKRMRRIILSSVACLGVTGVATFSAQRKIFLEEFTEHMCIMRPVTFAIF